MISAKQLVLVILLTCTYFVSAGKKQKVVFQFVQLTDTQLGMTSKNENSVEEERLYKLAIDEVNKLKPAFVVITGDFVNQRSDTNQIKTFLELTSLFDKKIPIYLIPGNHDVGQKPDKGTLDFYFRFYPTDRFSFAYKGVQFIGINSCLVNSGIEEETVQFNWLKQELNKNTTRKIIFSHHPFFTHDFNEKDSYSNIPFTQRSEYMRLFQSHGVAAVVAGHYHNNAEAQFQDIPMITTSAVGKQLGKANSGFRIIRVYNDSISHSYFELPVE
ncbi:MAG: metallophosphoesterase [Paludibacter sp.]|jgi:3',5'-cyclic AMP phosphodiesterase CpdA|nr:metallophosphoesterase [Paludibacter sp.]